MISLLLATAPLHLAAAPLTPSVTPSVTPSPLGAAAHAAGLASDIEGDLTELRGKLATSLEELALWCHDKKLYLQRDRFYEGLIQVDVDHSKARKTLGYKRKNKDEPWVLGKYKAPKDRAKPGAMDELEAEREARMEPLRRPLLDVLDQPGVSRKKRAREAELYLALAPNDRSLRFLMGEMRGVDGDWVNADVARTRTRRAELAEMVQRYTSEVPELEHWPITGNLADVNLQWTESFQTHRLKATGTGSEDEIRRAATVVHMLEDLLADILPKAQVEMIGRGKFSRPRDPQPEMLGKYGVFLLASPSQIGALLEGWENLTPEERELFPTLATALLDGRNSIGVWEADPVKRLDALVRQVIGIYLRDHYTMSTRQGWVWEGLGLYLTHLAVGTRLTYFIRPSGYVEANTGPRLGMRLMDANADWLAILVEELQKPKPPRLIYMLGKDVNSLSVREMLLAHGLAAYLTELHPQRLPVILKRIGAGEDSFLVFEEEFGMKMPEIEKELETWLRRMIGE